MAANSPNDAWGDGASGSSNWDDDWSRPAGASSGGSWHNTSPGGWEAADSAGEPNGGWAGADSAGAGAWGTADAVGGPGGGPGGGWEADSPAGRSGHKGVIIALVVLIALVALGGGGFAAWRAFAHDEESSAAASCATPPEFAAKDFSDTADGGLDVTFRATPTCDHADTVDGPSVEFVVYHMDSGKLKKVASGTFDFSEKPLRIDAEGSDVSLTFPHQTVYMSRGEMTGSEKFVVEVRDSRSGNAGNAGAGSTSGAPGTSESSATSTSASSSTTTSSSAKPAECTESSALAELESRRSTDRSKINDRMVGKWVPQISSKQVGLNAEGRTWDACAILKELQQNSSKYPDVALAWTSDWSSFDLKDWWITVVGLPYADAETALSWCRNNGFDTDHCYAKKITTSGGSEGTSRYNR